MRSGFILRTLNLRFFSVEPILAGVLPKDHHHFQAAQGWLELGDWKSANDELEEMTPRQQADPNTLRMRVEIYSAAKKWELAAEIANALRVLIPHDPFGHIRYAFALHELKRTQDALDALLPVADTFSTIWTIPYNLACYCCQLGDLVGARDWLAQSYKVGNAKEIEPQALDDPDLAPLWSAERDS